MLFQADLGDKADFSLDFPGVSAGKESVCNARNLGLIPG